MENCITLSKNVLLYFFILNQYPKFCLGTIRVKAIDDANPVG
jgi:hypothetical protein